MNEKATVITVLIIGFFLFLNAVSVSYETVKYPDFATAATTSAVNVTASVAQEISCATPAGSTAFGTLSATATTTSNPNATTTMSCGNVSGGCTLYVKDANAGLATTTPYTIPSPAAGNPATSTWTVGVEGYGIQAATTTDGSGAALALATRYSYTGDVIGGLVASNTTIASTSASTSGRVVDVTHKASISASTPAGSYTDTITYECSAT